MKTLVESTPAYLARDPALLRRLAEWRDGIGDAKIRPGFQKIGLDAGPLPEVGVKLVRAAARVHLASGPAAASSGATTPSRPS